MKLEGLTYFKVAMHGGNFYDAGKPEDSEKIAREQRTTAQLRALFNQPKVTVEIDEVSDRRGDKYTSLGAAIEQSNSGDLSVRLINELVAPQPVKQCPQFSTLITKN
ncbi:MAG: hypothetical protein CBCREVIR_3700 [Candidatus Burkholderia crenata]|nr:MAG: hypothetical protein CBCREVIR_3700 [Candidatus Burkholderia crenata]